MLRWLTPVKLVWTASLLFTLTASSLGSAAPADGDSKTKHASKKKKKKVHARSKTARRHQTSHVRNRKSSKHRAKQSLLSKDEALLERQNVVAKKHAHKRSRTMGKLAAPKPCFNKAAQIVRMWGETEDLVLTYCDGRPAPKAEEKLSVLIRPHTVRIPKDLPAYPSKRDESEEWVKGIKQIHPGLVSRLGAVAKHFPNKKVFVVSGYRPWSIGSLHRQGRAMDIRVEGVPNEHLVAFCRTLNDTGCGYYPNSVFIHMDVRPEKTGHVYWIDASGPGESANYVSSWNKGSGKDGSKPSGTKSCPPKNKVDKVDTEKTPSAKPSDAPARKPEQRDPKTNKPFRKILKNLDSHASKRPARKHQHAPS
jgi:hypothetical protein